MKTTFSFTKRKAARILDYEPRRLKTWIEMKDETSRGQTSEVADLLRSCRLKMGYDVNEVAHSLRIRPAYVEAMEDGRFGDLPSRPYALGFVRAYAGLLGLNGEEIVRRLKVETSGLEQKVDLRFPSPTPEGGAPKARMLLAGAVLALLTYGSWHLLSSRGRDAAEPVPPVPERLARWLPDSANEPKISNQDPGMGAETPASPTGVQTAALSFRDQEPGFSADAGAVNSKADRTINQGLGVAATVADGSLASRLATVDRAGVDGASRAAAAALAGNASANGATHGMASDTATVKTVEMIGRAFGASDGARIVLKAKADSWVQVRDALDNRVVLTRLLKPGDVYRVPDRPGLTLATGNAGGLDIFVDDAAIPSIGGNGTVRRGIPLEVSALLHEANAFR